MSHRTDIELKIFEEPHDILVTYSNGDEVTFATINSIGFSIDEEGMMFLFQNDDDLPAYIINMIHVRSVHIKKIGGGGWEAASRLNS